MAPAAQELMDCTVDYTVTGPSKEPGKEKIILEGEKERQGDYVFTANYPGEYRFCFDNAVSTFTDKLVDFEISVRYKLRDMREDIVLTSHTYRSKTSLAQTFPRNPAQLPSSSAVSKRPSSACPARSPPSPASRNTSAHVKTGTSARSGVRRRECSTSVCWKAL